MLVCHHITCEKFSVLFVWVHHFNMNNEVASHQLGDFFCCLQRVKQASSVVKLAQLWWPLKGYIPCKTAYSEQSISEASLKQPHNWSHSFIVHRFWMMMSLAQGRKCRTGGLKSACWRASHVQLWPETSCGMATALQSTLEVVWLGLLFSSLWNGE